MDHHDQHQPGCRQRPRHHRRRSSRQLRFRRCHCSRQEGRPVCSCRHGFLEHLGQHAIGKLANGSGSKPARVIGVVADIRESTLEQKSSPEIYVPMTQNPDVEGATLIVRSRMDPDALASSVLVTLRSLNPSQPASGFRPLQSLVDHSVSPRRFFVLLVTIFASLGALLAALGIYGVISYSVTQKTQEIGVRMALGATRGRIQRDVLWQTLRLAVTASPQASLHPWELHT